MVHVPLVFRDTTLPLSEHTEVPEVAIVKLTASPEDAVAVGVYVPPTKAPDGAVLVKVMVCGVVP
jgi:hypothetical protein